MLMVIGFLICLAVGGAMMVKGHDAMRSAPAVPEQVQPVKSAAQVPDVEEISH